jgi:DoxX-like family
MPGIYVEIDIRCAMEDLWAKTQLPDLHQQWDLRFTDIEYLPRPDVSQPQRFLYKTRIGFGVNIAGEGESVGNQESNGSRTSALKFWSKDRKSLIREGSGYWQYIPIPGGVRFLTWYDYATRFAGPGRLLDAVLFRPMLGWATAWSFDRLRLWLEKNIDPAVSLRQGLIYGISRLVVAFVWIYHGLVPKLLFADRDEATMLLAGGLAPEHLTTAFRVIGLAEIAFGLVLLAAWRAGILFVLTIVLMIVALVAVALRTPDYLAAAFNPVTLNIAMITLSSIGLLSARDLPSAARCKRKRVEDTA